MQNHIPLYHVLNLRTLIVFRPLDVSDQAKSIFFPKLRKNLQLHQVDATYRVFIGLICEKTDRDNKNRYFLHASH